MNEKESRGFSRRDFLNMVLIGTLAVAASRCKVSPTTPEATSTGTSPALIVEPPVGFEPSTPTPGGISTSTGGETSTPAESDLAAFRAPTLEELVVPMGEGGPLPKDAQDYYDVMNSAKMDVAQKVGVDPNKVNVRYWDNTGSHDDFGWMLYYQIEGAGVIWPLKPDGALADYPAYFDGEGQPDGTVENLRMNSDYNSWVIAGDKSTAAIFGGTLPVIVDSPKDAEVSGETKLVYSRWLRPGGQPVDYAKDFSEWQETLGVSEPTPTPEAVDKLKPDFSLDLLGTVNEEGVSLTVPFTVGLMKDIMERSVEPIKSFYVNPERLDAPDKLAYYYLRMCWLNHKKNYSEDANISWEEYLKRVKNGEGKIKLAIADPSIGSWNKNEKLNLKIEEFNPIDGFTYLSADKMFNIPGLNASYVTSIDGRLLIVDNFNRSVIYANVRNLEKDIDQEMLRGVAFTRGFADSIAYVLVNADIEEVLEMWGYMGFGKEPNFGQSTKSEKQALTDDIVPDHADLSKSKPYFLIKQ